MGSLTKHAKKIKKACIGIATGVTVATYCFITDDNDGSGR